VAIAMKQGLEKKIKSWEKRKEAIIAETNREYKCQDFVAIDFKPLGLGCEVAFKKKRKKEIESSRCAKELCEAACYATLLLSCGYATDSYGASRIEMITGYFGGCFSEQISKDAGIIYVNAQPSTKITISKDYINVDFSYKIYESHNQKNIASGSLNVSFTYKNKKEK
jgi:hypothetical protein